MKEILYRIYEVSDKKPNDSDHFFGMWSLSKQNSIEVAMDCILCESREDFKDIIKSQYGKDIRFSYSRKYPIGTVYCIIIGEHAYDVERYFNKVEYICGCCNCRVSGYIDKYEKLDDYEIQNYLCGQTDKYHSIKFCSHRCKEQFIEKERIKLLESGCIDESFITRNSFTKDCAGYIYKIKKKSTGEFYIGQTIYAPIFRWGQHLKTERFDIKNILDYQFETIEIVSKDSNILEREKYWIQKMYKECPEKSLNIMCTANLLEGNKHE